LAGAVAAAGIRAIDAGFFGAEAAWETAGKRYVGFVGGWGVEKDVWGG